MGTMNFLARMGARGTSWRLITKVIYLCVEDKDRNVLVSPEPRLKKDEIASEAVRGQREILLSVLARDDSVSPIDLVQQEDSQNPIEALVESESRND